MVRAPAFSSSLYSDRLFQRSLVLGCSALALCSLVGSPGSGRPQRLASASRPWYCPGQFCSAAFFDFCGRVPLGPRQCEPVLVSRSALPFPVGLSSRPSGKRLLLGCLAFLALVVSAKLDSAWLVCWGTVRRRRSVTM